MGLLLRLRSGLSQTYEYLSLAKVALSLCLCMHMNESNLQDNMDKIRYGIYAIMGPNLMLTNALLFTIIMRHKALRQLKEYTIIAALAFVDSLAGFGDMSAGFYRLHKILTNQHRVNVSRRDCFLTVHEPVWTVSMPLQGVMLCIVSLDRFMSVWDPLRYLGFSRKYAVRMILIVYGFGIAFLCAGALTVWNETEPEVGAICNFAWGLKHKFSQLAVAIRSSSFLLSVAAYGAMGCVFSSNNIIMAQQCTSAQKHELKRQRRFTKSVTISCVFTFILSALPSSVWLGAYIFDQHLYTISVWANILSNLNPTFNLWIFLKRHKELRQGLHALAHCKRMPEKLQNWSVNNNRTKAASRGVQELSRWAVAMVQPPPPPPPQQQCEEQVETVQNGGNEVAVHVQVKSIEDEANNSEIDVVCNVQNCD